jgi:hypothetical protein
VIVKPSREGAAVVDASTQDARDVGRHDRRPHAGFHVLDQESLPEIAIAVLSLVPEISGHDRAARCARDGPDVVDERPSMGLFVNDIGIKLAQHAEGEGGGARTPT